jgi:hypothetical protein
MRGVFDIVSDIQEGAATAAIVGLSKAMDAFYEAEAGMRVGRAATLVRAYSFQIATIARSIDRRAAQDANSLDQLPPAPRTTPPPRAANS